MKYSFHVILKSSGYDCKNTKKYLNYQAKSQKNNKKQPIASKMLTLLLTIGYLCNILSFIEESRS